MISNTVIVIGPSGNGKSTLAKALAKRLGWRFIEGDEHHPPGNIAKLTRGEPLSEADRQPFLESIARALTSTDDGAIVACSALRRAHRDILREARRDAVFAWPSVPFEELQRRVLQRRQHFMAPALLRDQIETFEPPGEDERTVRVNGCLTTDEQVRRVVAALQAPPMASSPGERRLEWP